MPSRVLIAGPPCAGKSTLARRIAQESGAQVVDFDAIAVELGSPHPWDHPRDVVQAAAAEFDRRVEAASGPVVVIRSAPTAQERATLASRIGADEVRVLAVPAVQAKARAVRDGRPDWTADAIDRWWSRYQHTDHPEQNVQGDKPETREHITMSTPTTDPTTPTPADVAAQQQTANSGSPTGATNPEPASPTVIDHEQYPENHPLVRAYAAQKDEIAGLRDQRTQLEADHQAALYAATQRAEAAEAEAAQIDTRVAESLRSHLATVHQINDEDRDLYLTSTDPDTLLRQVQGLVARRSSGTGYVPSQGTGGTPQVSSYELGRERALARLNNQNTAP